MPPQLRQGGYIHSSKKWGLGDGQRLKGGGTKGREFWEILGERVGGVPIFQAD
jgi:hypothetical protein